MERVRRSFAMDQGIDAAPRVKARGAAALLRAAAALAKLLGDGAERIQVVKGSTFAARGSYVLEPERQRGEKRCKWKVHVAPTRMPKLMRDTALADRVFFASPGSGRFVLMTWEQYAELAGLERGAGENEDDAGAG
jgi:hypothetical protein